MLILSVYFLKCSILILFTNTGLLHGQKKSGKVRKTKKNEKSQVKMGVFEKSQEKIIKKLQVLSVQIYNLLIFKSLPLIKN